MKLVEPRQLLEAVQNALTQQGKSGAAIHHSLDEFYPGHLPFCLRVVVGMRQPHENSGFVLLQAIGEPLQFLNPSFRHRGAPSRKRVLLPACGPSVKTPAPIGRGSQPSRLP